MNDSLSFYERKPAHASIGIVGVPIELGIDEAGPADAPNYLLESGLERALEKLGCGVSGVEMMPCAKRAPTESFGAAKYLREIAQTAQASCDAVQKVLARGDFALALGGDHSAAIGTIAGASLACNKKIGVIYIDAHPDCHTPETTITGKIHGMSAAAAMGFGHPLLTGVGGKVGKIAPEHFLYVGLKDIDQAEIEFIRRVGAPAITMLDIASRGLSPALAAIDELNRNVDAVWVSMDMDSIDEKDAPGVGLAMPGGLTRREVLALAHQIGKTSPLLGLDVVEISPQKDIERKTAALAIELVARFLGTEYSWYQNEYIDAYRETNVVRPKERTTLPPRAKARSARH